MELLERGRIDTSAVLREASFHTTVKTRIIARNQQVVRVDREKKAALDGAQEERVKRLLDGSIASADAIVVADYGKGFLTQSLADYICRAAREHGKILTVDPHPHTSLSWRGATAVKPNRAEALLAAGLPPSDPVDPPLCDAAGREAGERLLRVWETECLLITLGEQGMLLLRPGAEPYHMPARAKEVFDVSGAGDTALAIFTLGLAAGAAPWEAADLANSGSGIVVGKVGTATATAAELIAALGGV